MLVWCHLRLGDLEREAGNLAAAEEQYRRAGVVADAVRANPADAQHADRNAAVVAQKLGDLALARNQLDGAATHYRQCAALLKPRAEDGTRRAEFERDYGVSLDKLGEVAEKQGHLAEAR
ncbi:MAG: hypothetical protein ACRCZF_20730, partial [Gemmataceae bacterium]